MVIDRLRRTIEDFFRPVDATPHSLKEVVAIIGLRFILLSILIGIVVLIAYLPTLLGNYKEGQDWIY